MSNSVYIALYRQIYNEKNQAGAKTDKITFHQIQCNTMSTALQKSFS